MERMGRECGGLWVFGDERVAFVKRPDQETQKVDLVLGAHRGDDVRSACGLSWQEVPEKCGRVLSVLSNTGNVFQ